VRCDSRWGLRFSPGTAESQCQPSDVSAYGRLRYTLPPGRRGQRFRGPRCNACRVRANVTLSGVRGGALVQARHPRSYQGDAIRMDRRELGILCRGPEANRDRARRRRHASSLRRRALEARSAACPFSTAKTRWPRRSPLLSRWIQRRQAERQHRLGAHAFADNDASRLPPGDARNQREASAAGSGGRRWDSLTDHGSGWSI
jgi:hypothetical protein